MWRSKHATPSKSKQNAAPIVIIQFTESTFDAIGVCVSVFFSLCFVLFVVWPFACLFVCSVCVGSCMHACVMKWYAECKIVFENYLNVLYVIKLTNNDDNNCDWFGRNKCNVFWAV